MGRIHPTASRLLLAITMLVARIAVAADSDEATDIAGVTLAANMPTPESVLEAPVLPEDEILHLFGLYREARGTGMWEEAEVLAKQIVELSITEYGHRSRRTAEALTGLGEMQADNGDYYAAMLNLAQAIEIIENIDDYLAKTCWRR